MKGKTSYAAEVRSRMHRSKYCNEGFNNKLLNGCKQPQSQLYRFFSNINNTFQLLTSICVSIWSHLLLLMTLRPDLDLEVEVVA